jgi:hypothetical protein
LLSFVYFVAKAGFRWRGNNKNAWVPAFAGMSGSD